jgi:hypothetical protein
MQQQLDQALAAVQAGAEREAALRKTLTEEIAKRMTAESDKAHAEREMAKMQRGTHAEMVAKMQVEIAALKTTIAAERDASAKQADTVEALTVDLAESARAHAEERRRAADLAQAITTLEATVAHLRAECSRERVAAETDAELMRLRARLTETTAALAECRRSK